MTPTEALPQATVTDILAEAANAQFRAADFMGAGVLRGVAPAKVNLFLGVGGARADGRHDVVNVMQALSLHDGLHVNATPLDDAFAKDAEAAIAAGSEVHAFAGPQDRLLVSVEMVDKTVGLGDERSAVGTVPVTDNLAFKAVVALAQAAPRSFPSGEHVRIRVEKHIPAQAGLGGGSSDAACVLSCLARLWDLDAEALPSVAASLGADVPFFLEGGCALFDGAGERFVRTLDPLRTPVLVVKPFAGVSTKAAYVAFDADPQLPDPALLDQVQHARSADEVPLFNGLANAADAVQPEVARVREWLRTQEGVDARRMLLSGSGSAFFVEAGSFAEASKLAAAAKQAGFWARPTAFSRLRAQAL